MSVLAEAEISRASSALALEDNLVLFAGAGTGKTHGLVTLALHLLGGARARSGPIPPSKLCLLTFTEKAAGEMRARLRRRVEGLAEGIADEPELLASFAEVGRAPPPPSFWRAVADGLGAATVSTFHSLCIQILRRAPPGRGVDPSFELLAEDEAASTLHDCAERCVIAALEKNRADVVELCCALGFSGASGGSGLVELLARISNETREEGLSPATVTVGDPAWARAEFEAALVDAREALDALVPWTAGAKGKWVDALEPARAALAKVGFDCFAERFADFCREAPRAGPRGEAKPAFDAYKEAAFGEDGLEARFASVAAARHEATFRALLVELGDAYRARLDRVGALDFTELLVRARDLLRDEPELRREVQARFGALLVDEFQDTNRLQLELVLLLAERREGGPRALPATSVSSDLALEQGFLCVVGDRKQSIYDFRGADVAVFGELAERIAEAGGRTEALRRSWRSTPELVAFCNGLFERVLAERADPRPFEVGWNPERDALTPVRSGDSEGKPCIETIDSERADGMEACRRAEAEALARRLADLLDPARGEQVVADGAPRPIRGGDVALLFRSFTNLEIYRAALVRHGLPHRVWRGRGFYGAQEVVDVAAFLGLLADPLDCIRWAAVLRSPWVGLSDDGFVRVMLDARSPLEVTPELLSGLAEDEAERLERFAELFRTLRPERERIGGRRLLEVAFERTGLRVALAAAPFGEQMVANLDALLERAARWEARRPGDLEGFARALWQASKEEPREAQADVLDSLDPRAISLLTIHQSKGLEWPVVVVPDLARRDQTRSGAVGFDRDLGLAIRPRGLKGQALHSRRSARLFDEQARRERAESARLLYVAATRARDRLILSGRAPEAKTEAGSWRGRIDAWCAESGLLPEGSAPVQPDAKNESAGPVQPERSAQRGVEGSADPRTREPPSDSSLHGDSSDADPSTPALCAYAQGERGAPPGLDSGQGARVLESVIARARTPVVPRPRSVLLPVTQLQAHDACPRRYRFLHELRLPERPSLFEHLAPEDASRDDDGPGVDARDLGTTAHALLEKVDLGLTTREARAAQLRSLLSARGWDPDSESGREVTGWVEAFLDSEWGRRLSAAPERAFRELPFVLRLGGEPSLLLRGQIDLLFEEPDGSVTVLDYKATKKHPNTQAAYGFQLGCYALAARGFLKAPARIRTGIVYLRTSPLQVELSETAPAELEALEAHLVEQASALLEASRTGLWGGRPAERCRKLGCGFLARCHPGGV